MKYILPGSFIFSFLLVFTSIEPIIAQIIERENYFIAPAPNHKNVCTLEPSGEDAFISIPRHEILRKSGSSVATPTAQFEVNYRNACGNENWPTQAMEAFDYALDIWSTHLSSSIPIRVEASWVALGGNTLGSAGPTLIISLSGIGEPNTWYTIAQASAMLDQDIVSEENAEYDIVVNLNCNTTSWYFGTDAIVPAGRIDLVTVVLHEIGHGIGFFGSASVSNQSGSYGYGTPPNPMIYDIFVRDGQNRPLIRNFGVYPNPSGALFSAYTGDRGGIYFDSFDTRIVNNGNPARLYSPSSWSAGSSFSHLDQASFGGPLNRLMRPFADASQAVHTPGPVFCSMLYTWGWPLGSDCTTFVGSESLMNLSQLEVEPIDFGITRVGNPITKTYTIGADLLSPDNLILAADIFSNSFQIIGDKTFSISPDNNVQISVRYNPTSKGEHTAFLRILHNASNIENPLILDLQGEAFDRGIVVELSQNYPNPFNNGTVIPIALPEESNVLLQVFNTLGQPVATLVDAQLNAGRYSIPFNISGLASGVYFYRIVVNNYVETKKMLILR